MLSMVSIAQPAPASPHPTAHLPALAGDHFEQPSRYTDRTYHIHVRLPEAYEAQPDRRWPVVYVLDGDSLFPLLAPTHLFLHYDVRLPDAIVVGIAYGSFDPAVNKRHVDFSAPGADTPADEGGAPAFLDFLREELLPATEARYRIETTRRVLLGQSRSGYFVLWSALQAPDLFWGRIASNPALSRDREALFLPPATPRPPATEEPRVVLASGARDAGFRVVGAQAWYAHWHAHPDRPWALQLDVLPDGTHAASIGEAYGRAMRWLFREDIAQAATAAAE